MPAVIPGIVAGLAAIGITGTVATIIANVIALALSFGLSMGLSALLKSKPDKPTISNRRQQLLTTVRDPVAPRELIVGATRKGGIIHFFESVNNESELLMGVILGGHEIEAIDEIYNFDELMIDQSGIVQPKYRDLVEFEKFLGTDAQQASTILLDNFPGYTAEDRLCGIAHCVFKFQFNRDIFNQYPSISAKLRGAKAYDPRDDSIKYTPNAALVNAFYINHLIYGLNAAYGTDIDNTRLSASANECDEDVAIKAGKTLQFDGAGNEIVISHADILNPTGSFTVEVRIYPIDITNDGNIISKDDGTNGYGLQLFGSGRIRFFARGLSGGIVDSPDSAVVANTWQHIAGRFDDAADTLSLFIDGVQVAEATGATGTLAANSALRLSIGGTENAFVGRIQDVRLWLEARTATEIAAFHDKTLVGSEDNLAGYWKLDEKRGDRVEDATEIAHDGDITGAVWVDDDSILGTERRFHANGVIFSDQSPGEIIEDLLTSMAGSSVFSGGKWLIRAAVYEPPTVELSEDDAFDSIKIQPKRSRRDLFNAVRGTFISPENQYQPADFPLITVPGLEAQDGPTGSPERIVQDIELPFTSSSSMAQRLGYLHLLRNREQVSCSFPAKLKGLQLIGGGTCKISDQDAGWSQKPFEVVEWELTQVSSGEQDGNGDDIPALGVRVQGRETNPIIYDFNPATDEVPLNPSPDSNLPSPFGPIAIITDFVDRTGFEEISSPEQAGFWPGTIVGFVRNPWTGHLNVQDLIGADGNDFDVFDQYVQTPVRRASYESPEIDIEFSDIVRTYTESAFVKGPGEIGGMTVTSYYDTRLVVAGGFDPDAFNPDAFYTSSEHSDYPGWKRITKSVKAEGRYFKHKIEVAFVEGAGGYLASFTPIIDKMTLYQRGTAEIIPAGGKTFIFDERYHNIPSMSFAVRSSSARTVVFPSVTKTGFSTVVFNADADDSGGVIDWQSAGV